MKLTPENLDEMDCRPLNRNTGIGYVPEHMRKIEGLQELRDPREADQTCAPEIGAAGPSEPG